MTRRRPERVIVIREAKELNGCAAYVDVTAGGKVTYGIRVSGRSIAKCRESAQREFTALRQFVARIERVQKVEEKT